MERAMGHSLKALSLLATSPLVERLGLSDSMEKLVYRGTKAGLKAATGAAKRAGPVVKLLTPDRMQGTEPKRTDLVDLTLSDSQELVRDTMARFAKERMQKAALEADELGEPPAGFLEEAHELGLSQLAVPEALGGAGDARSMLTNVIIAEELARGDMGLALAALAPLAVVHALVEWGTAEQQGTYLPLFVSDHFLPAGLALLEPRALACPERPKTRASLSGTDYEITGEKALVPLAEDAEVLLVVADLGGTAQAFLIDKGTEGLSITKEPAMGLRAAKLARVTLDHVRVPRSAKLGGDAGIDVARLIDLSRIAWGAMCVGTCSAMIDYVKTYCSERTAFGEPITHRQSVAFTIADMAIETDAMRLMVLRAASRAEQGLSFRREASLVRLQCSDKGMQIGTNGVQMLGGHGFIKEHPVELWYRQLRAIGVFEGALLV
jgi:alkylation response protein AidB-like acyl-CoA dehydrogenase